MKRLLLCTDLDRTLLPNGDQPESPPARRLFRHLVAHGDLKLVYATGRDLGRTIRAIEDYDLPSPEVIIADVGSTIFLRHETTWRPWTDWEHHIDQQWHALSPPERHMLIGELPEVRLQESGKQGRYKISLYVSLAADRKLVQEELQQRLQSWQMSYKLIWSVDEQADTQLLDILPAGAGKLQALRFLMDALGYAINETLFAGDSGNDLEVLESGIPAVLVANAHPSLRQQLASTKPHALYLAQGGHLGMNGNYAAGILEGVAHFWPYLDGWLQEELNKSGDV